MTIQKILDNDPMHRTLAQATKVYHGRENCCRCGCGGKYYDVGTRGFKMAVNKMSKPEFEPLAKGILMWAKDHVAKCEGVVYGENYIDIPYDADNDKCYCLYFD